MKLLTTNLCTENGTTVTTSSNDPSFPGSNLRKPFRSHKWRATDCDSESVTFDMLTTEAVDSVVLMWPLEDGIKLTPAAVVTIQANATNVWTSPAFEQVIPISDNYSIASLFFDTDKNYRYWRITIEDPTNPWGYVELGQVWIGKSLPVEAAQNGFRFVLSDQSKITQTDFGHTYADEYPTLSSIAFSYAYLDYDAVVTLENAYRTNGNRKPVMVCVDPFEAVFNQNHYLIYGMFKGSFVNAHVSYNLFNNDLSVEETA